MSQPRRFTSHENATTTGPGEKHKTRAHPQIGFFVTADGIDPSTDSLEVRLEVSPANTHYAPIDNASPAGQDVMLVTQDDLVESDADSNVYVQYTTYHNAPIEYIRANIITHSGGFEVTTDLYLSGWTQRGTSFEYATHGT